MVQNRSIPTVKVAGKHHVRSDYVRFIIDELKRDLI
jgi:hypothetical protein